MYFSYYETSRKSPTVVDLPGTSESEKNRASAYNLVSAYIGIKFDDGTIKPDESGVYAEIYSDDGIKLSELHRVGNSTWDWVDFNPLIL